MAFKSKSQLFGTSSLGLWRRLHAHWGGERPKKRHAARSQDCLWPEL